MAELKPMMGVAHPDLLSTSCQMIIIYQLWQLTTTHCHILQDIYTGCVSQFWCCIALLPISLAGAGWTPYY